MQASVIPLLWFVLAASIVASVCDVVYRRIPNALVIGIALVAVSVHVTQGAAAFAQSLAAMSLVLIAGTFAHARGWVGGGDVKLAAAIAAVLNFPDTFAFLLYMSLSGGVLALVSIALYRWTNVFTRLRFLFANLIIGIRPSLSGESHKMPYALAMSGGLVLVLSSHTVLPCLRLFS